MKNLALFFLLSTLTLTGFAQKPGGRTGKKPDPAATIENKADESAEFQKARSQPVITERIAALKKFVEDFPESENKTRALELISSSRAELGDQKLRLSDSQGGIELFNLAVEEAPTPVSEKLYREILIHLPTNLLFRGQGAAALKLAQMIEEKIGDNPKQILGLAGFYLATENASEAKRLAEKVIAIDPSMATAFQTLGMANRINFDLEGSINAYGKALELDPASVVSKKSLAEVKRANGQTDEAIDLYRQALETDPADESARTGLILSLFDAERRAEAEAEMNKSLEANPGNLFLLVGAAYWYAAHKEGDKAVELAQKAVAFEPRYTWAHIALARGLIQQKKPLEAERTLLIARQYGYFPTLNYELASARLAAGLYREAADELRKSFSVKNGLVSTNLGGRVLKEGNSFAEILAAERRASIFEPMSANDPKTDEKLKALLNLSQTVETRDEIKINDAVDEFVKGDDNMKTHRRLYAARNLLEKRTAVPKALEMAGAAAGEVNKALEVTTPGAAVLADELYESRMLAISRNQMVIVPEIPRQTLLRILRGRIEELAGWALFQQENPTEAATRLKRAVSVLPENSAWWRSSKWRLGDALAAEGKEKEALDAYIAGYNRDAPDLAKRTVIESIYEKINGTNDGLDQIIGPKPVFNIPTSEKTGEEAAVETDDSQISADPETSPTPADGSGEVDSSGNVPSANSETPVETPTPTPAPTPETLKIPENVPLVEASPTPTPAETPKTETPASGTPTGEEKKDDKPVTAPGENDPAARALVDFLKPAEKPVKTEATPTPAPDENLTAQITDEEKAGSPPEQLKPTEDPSASIPKENSGNEPGKPINPTEKTVDKPITDRAGPENSLFQPVIITVPKKEAAGSGNPSLKTPPPPTEEKPVEKTDDQPEETSVAGEEPPAKKDENATIRPRIFAGGSPGSEEIAPCRLKVSEEKISLINDGGSLGMFVGFEGSGDPSKIVVRIGSPKDISVSYQPDVGVLSERAFFIIKSVSPNLGVYTVTFESPCGKKDVTVTVR
ncbi:MAG: tetratricopeptide repeat protein [Pyrinomonadaceae bacterium]